MQLNNEEEIKKWFDKGVDAGKQALSEMLSEARDLMNVQPVPTKDRMVKGYYAPTVSVNKEEFEAMYPKGDL